MPPRGNRQDDYHDLHPGKPLGRSGNRRTGSNQAFIFETNKQRLQVAASRLVHELGHHWVPEALEGVGRAVRHVVKASGKAAILTSPEVGRQVIEIVTRRAALEGAGIDVWGVIGTKPVADDLSDAGERLHQAVSESLSRLKAKLKPKSSLDDRPRPRRAYTECAADRHVTGSGSSRCPGRTTAATTPKPGTAAHRH